MFQPLKILTKLKKRPIKYKKIMGFDIETATDKNEFVLACFYSKDLKKVCHSKEEVVRFLCSRKVRAYTIFATNLAFDFLGSVYEHSNRWKVNERNGVIYSFKWYQECTDNILKHPVQFFDTMRIMPASVQKLGKILNQPKIEHPKCFKRFPNNKEELEELTTYCMNDAKISEMFVSNIVIPFLNKYNLRLKSTIGSIALEDFRKNYLKETLFQEKEEIRNVAFKSYYGGRTETFMRGKFKNVFCFDINSLYPSVMLKAFPNPNRSRLLKAGTYYNIQKYEGVSEIEVVIPKEINIPPLPYKSDGKLIFPTGKIKGYYNHNEIRNAIKHGCTVTKIFEQVVYPKTEFFFKDFVLKHYSERRKLQKENSPLQVMEKNVMNNLYGKFAFNYKEISSLIPAHEFDFEKHVKKATFIQPMFDNQFISISAKNNDAPIYSFPILSSYITSEARIKMYEYLSDKNIQHKIISTDTDSIFIKDYEGEIKTSNELGDMKLEDGYPINEGYFVRPKMYMTAYPKCKGVKFTENPKEQFMKILKGESITQERFVKYRTAIRSKEHHKYGELTPNQIIEITKELNLNDTKREWEKLFEYDEEQTSKPLHIDYTEQEQLKKLESI